MESTWTDQREAAESKTQANMKMSTIRVRFDFLHKLLDNNNKSQHKLFVCDRMGILDREEGF